MARRKDADDWLEWAQGKYDQAQERFAWSERSTRETMDSYATLIGLIERGMIYADRQGSARMAEADALLELAEQMESLGEMGHSFRPSEMVAAGKMIRSIVNG